MKTFNFLLIILLGICLSSCVSHKSEAIMKFPFKVEKENPPEQGIMSDKDYAKIVKKEKRRVAKINASITKSVSVYQHASSYL